MHVVVCEGLTEEHCLNLLRQHFRKSNVVIDVQGQAGVPSSVMKRANQRLEASRGTDTKVYAVFDRDEHPCFDEAVRRLADWRHYDDPGVRGIFGGISVPCFELWATLLHRDQTAHIERQAIQRALRDVHMGYHHESNARLNADQLIAGLGDAFRRMLELRRRADDADDEYYNPTSTFSLVVHALFGDELRSDSSCAYSCHVEWPNLQ